MAIQRRKLVVCLLLAVASIPKTHQKVVKGRIAAAPDLFNPSDPNAADKLHFLGKFCYGNTHGGFGTLKVETRSKEPGVHLILLDDVLWGKIWSRRTSISCRTVLDKTSGQNTWGTEIPTGKNTIKTSIFDIMRPHYWYAAAINCQHALDLDYTITFTNPGGDPLSFDQHGVLHLYSLFGVASIALLIFHVSNHSSGSGGGLPALITSALILASTTSALKLLHIMLARHLGIEGLAADSLGDVTHAICDVIIGTTLLICAYGYGVAISMPQSSQNTRFPFWCSAALSVSSFILLVYGWAFTDAADSTSSYESTPGMLHACCLVGAGCASVVGARALHANSLGDARRQTYALHLGAISALWFLAVPLLMSLLHVLVHAYLRDFVIAFARCVVDALFLAAAVWWLRPGGGEGIVKAEAGLYELLDRGTGGGGGYQDL